MDTLALAGEQRTRQGWEFIWEAFYLREQRSIITRNATFGFLNIKQTVKVQVI